MSETTTDALKKEMTKDEKKAAQAEEEEKKRIAKQAAIDNDPKGVENAAAAVETAEINFNRVVSNFTNDTGYEGSIADMHHATVMLAYYKAAQSRAILFADKLAGIKKYAGDSYFFDDIFQKQMASNNAVWRKYDTHIDEWRKKIREEQKSPNDLTKTSYLRKRAEWADMIATAVHAKTLEIRAENTEKAEKRKLNRLATPNLNFTLGKSIYTVESTEKLEKKKNELLQQLETNPEFKQDLDLIEQELKVRTKAQQERYDMNQMTMISDAARKMYTTAKHTELLSRKEFIDRNTPTAEKFNELNVANYDKLLKQTKSKLDEIMNAQDANIRELERELLQLKYEERQEIIKYAEQTGFDKTSTYNSETVTADDVKQHVKLNYTVPDLRLDPPAVMSGIRVTELDTRIRAVQKRLNEARKETPEERQAKYAYNEANKDFTLAQITLAETKVKLATQKTTDTTAQKELKAAQKELEEAQKELEEARINFKNSAMDKIESDFKQFLDERRLETSPVVISSDFNRIAAIELVMRIYNELRQLRNSDDSLVNMKLKMKLKSKATDAVDMAKKYINGDKKEVQNFMKQSIERRSVERDAFSAAMRTDRIANNALLKAEKENPEEAKKVAEIAREIEIASTTVENAESAVNLAKFNVEDAMNAAKYYEKEALQGQIHAESYEKEIGAEEDSKKKEDLLKKQAINTKYSEENRVLADKKNEDAAKKKKIYQEKLQLAERANAEYDAKTKKYLEALYTLSPYCREKRDEANIADQKWLVAALKLMKAQRKEYEERDLAISYTPGYQTIKERLMEKPNYVESIHNKINMAKGKVLTREHIIELINEPVPFNTEDFKRLQQKTPQPYTATLSVSELKNIADYYILDNKLQEVNQTMDDWEKEWEKQWDIKQSDETGKIGGTRKNKKRTRKHNIKKSKKTRRHRSKRYKH